MTYLTASAAANVRGAAPTRVLVVDDSDQLVGLVGAWLEDEGYFVTTATTGQRAIAAAAADPPDVVLLDLILPPPDGFALCEVLQRGPNPPAIVVMTGMTDALRLRQLDDLGVVGILRKPFVEHALLDAVSRARRRRWDELRPSAR